MMRLLALLALAAIVPYAADFTADSAQGRRLFDSLSCVQCHGINGKGGTIGPDLGRIADRGFTPSTLAATMWNHAPAMWAAMQKQGIHAGDLDEQAAADLFAYFYSARFFEQPGDAGRGKQAFTSRGCANCHGLTQSLRPLVKPVGQWESLADPVALTEAMWNHGPQMLAETQIKHQPWPDLQAQQLSDILVYLRNLPAPPSKPPSFRIGAGSNGEAVFHARACASCHPSVAGLSSRVSGKTLTEVAAAMWNHQPLMAKAGATPTKFAPDEMRELLGFVWAQQFFVGTGNASAGRRVFVVKHCAGCHDAQSGAPRQLRRTRHFNGTSMVSALWQHGPSMLAQMKADRVPWPRFEARQMADLIAYLNSKKP